MSATKRKQAVKRLTRLEEKLEKRENERLTLLKKIQEIKTKKNDEESIIVKECEKSATRRRTKYYDTIRKPHKTWPRIPLQMGVIRSKIHLLELVKMGGNDLIRPIVSKLAPMEYQALGATSKQMNQLLQDTDMFHYYIDSFIQYLEVNELYQNLSNNALTTGRNFHNFSELLRIMQKITQTSIYSDHQQLRIVRPTDRFIKWSKLFEAERLFFFNLKSGEFGEVSNDDILFSDRSWNNQMQNNSFAMKYNVKATENMVLDTDIISLQIKPLSKLNPSTGRYIDLYMLDQNSKENYYKLLTQKDNRICLFHFLSTENVLTNIYYDWFFIRRIMKEYSKKL